MYKYFEIDSVTQNRDAPIYVHDHQNLLARMHPSLLHSLPQAQEFESAPPAPVGSCLLVAQFAEIDQVIENIKNIKNTSPRCQIMLLSQYEGYKQLGVVIRSGARHCLCLQDPTEVLVAQVDQARQGKITMCQSALRALVDGLQSQAIEMQERLAELTLREKQTLEFIALGFTNKDIADQLGIAEGTVKVHVKNLLRKLGFKTRLAAASWLYAYEHGLM
ncbi:MAG: Response regulator containing a CheY-like receiver domain and an HTH DNA-binding domain [Idiomarinaceae bacterium HL-53]|nr:MAG: Response regulator containing a CheY-like receiver domain and an HTH DNA-binding domain [Idiomarinaceae bacterium HL-53]CUS47747.1 two-component system, NarL family, nitrate/nitrite response regulator NarL [Idiomarinaceae bacterium HL-53]